MPKPGSENDLADYEFEKHVNLSTQLNRWSLKSIGLWPASRDISRWKKFYYILINVFCCFLVTFLYIPCGLHIFFEVTNLRDTIKYSGPLVFLTMAYLKYCLMLLQENNIRECLEHIEQDWRSVSYHDGRNIMIVNANFGRKLGMICIFFMYSSFALYFVILPFKDGKITVEGENLTFLPEPYPFPTFIADARRSPMNEIVRVFQLLGGILVVGIPSATCNLAAMLATHACGQMEVLINWLKHLIDGRMDTNQTLDDRIVDIVNYHEQILKFLALVEKTLRQLSFVDFVGCTAIICCSEYDILMEWKLNNVTGAITYAVLATSFTFNIFIFCYIGEIVAQQCKKVGETSYMIEWYRIPGKRKLCCVLIIAMSNSSIKLTAGNMVDLTIDTFANVVKTSFALLNVLHTTL